MKGGKRREKLNGRRERKGEYYLQVTGGKQRGGDVQETDGQNELGNEMGGEAGKGGVSWNG